MSIFITPAKPYATRTAVDVRRRIARKRIPFNLCKNPVAKRMLVPKNEPDFGKQEEREISDIEEHSPITTHNTQDRSKPK